MRVTSEQTISEQLTQRVAELTARVAELTRRLDLVEVVRGNGRSHPQTEPTVHGADDSSNPIEFLTENGFVIVRPWEAGNAPAPADGSGQFVVSDPNGKEQKITVTISRNLMAETEIHSNGRIDRSSVFWTSCAEKHLADYLTEHGNFPPDNQLIVDALDCEEVVSATRWGKHQTWE